MKVSRLSKFTTAERMLDILKKRKITFTNPKYWDDENDKHSIELVRAKNGWENIAVLCLVSGTERYHHWRSYAERLDGVRIKYNAPVLAEFLQSQRGVFCRKVEYGRSSSIVKKLQRFEPDLADTWPMFLKNKRYNGETEFRFVSTSGNTQGLRHFPIKPNFIKGVTLSPWMPQYLGEILKKEIQGIKGFSSLSVSYSTVLEYRSWKKRVEDLY